MMALADEYRGFVRDFYINQNNLALVGLDPIDPTSNTQPNCSTGLWQFKFDPSTEYGKGWTSMILLAKTAKLPVVFGYSAIEGYCGLIHVYLPK